MAVRQWEEEKEKKKVTGRDSGEGGREEGHRDREKSCLAYEGDEGGRKIRRMEGDRGRDGRRVAKREERKEGGPKGGIKHCYTTGLAGRKGGLWGG